MLDLTKPLQFKKTHQKVEHIYFSEKYGQYLAVYRDDGFIQPRTSWIKKHDIYKYLENISPPPYIRYINWYKDSNGVPFPGAECHFDNEEAEKNACGTRIACTKIEFVEGQFDE